MTLNYHVFHLFLDRFRRNEYLWRRSYAGEEKLMDNGFANAKSAMLKLLSADYFAI